MSGVLIKFTRIFIFFSIVTFPYMLYANTKASSFNMYGTTGLIELPSAESRPEADFNVTIGSFDRFTRGNFGFQVLPRLSGTFRYSRIDKWHNNQDKIYDKSFDFQYKLIEEGPYHPAMAVGVRDFIGTGLYASQYLVGTKHLSSDLKATLGLGWGRLSGLQDVQDIGSGLRDQLNINNWFKGSPSIFGGIEWQTPIDRLRFKLEYSPDKYAKENSQIAAFDRASSVNVGVEYSFDNGIELGGYYLYGSEIAFKLSTVLNPNRNTGLRDKAPVSIIHRDLPLDLSTNWLTIEGIHSKAQMQLNEKLNRDGIFIEKLFFDGNYAQVRIINNRYNAVAQAIGRTARVMARVFPDSVETFGIILLNKGIAGSLLKIKRSDLEAYENHPDGTRLMARKVDIIDVPMPKRVEKNNSFYPKFNWSLQPYMNVNIFSSNKPLSTYAGLRLQGSYAMSSKLSFSGALSKHLFQPSTSLSVNNDSKNYKNQSNLVIEHLTAQYMYKATPSIYGRITAGLLERMYAGISAELLWKPAEQKWGLGAELNYVNKRDFDQIFGLRDDKTTTGYVSLYYELPRDFHAQVDVGKYLDGDTGATISLERVFGNGWRVGTYATLTNLSEKDRGASRFGKGLYVEIPVGWARGKPSKKTRRNNLISFNYDGGSRLNVRNRLYDIVSSGHASNITRTWGRFWR